MRHDVARSTSWMKVVALALLLGACARAVPVTTVILVRHAERPPGTDPELSADGLARAESLAVALSATHIDAIIHTQFKRTQQTAAPLAARKGITPMVLSAAGASAAHEQAVVDQVRRLAGRTIVYVGHSNTVPGVIQRLGIASPVSIPDSQYHDLFIVMQKGEAVPSMIRARYGGM
jgi:broad specificity phosphatase PhoE